MAHDAVAQAVEMAEAAGAKIVKKGMALAARAGTSIAGELQRRNL